MNKVYFHFIINLTASVLLFEPKMVQLVSDLINQFFHRLLYFCIDVSSGYEGGLGDVAVEVLHMLLTYLMLQPNEDLCVPQDNMHNFLCILQRGIVYLQYLYL